MMARVAGPGQVEWIGVRPARHAPMQVPERVVIGPAGLIGDRRTRPGKRAVTLIQWEHLPVIAALAGLAVVEPACLRRNIAVAGINLLALKGRRFRIGTAILQGTGPCAPCSRMEAALGPGGYTAMRGRGGLTADVVEPGEVGIGDPVMPL